MGSQPWIIPAIRKVGKGHLDSVLTLVNADRANPSATAAVVAVSCETLLSWANASERSVGVSALSALQSAQGMGFERLGASAFYLPRESSGFCNLVQHNTEVQHCLLSQTLVWEAILFQSTSSLIPVAHAGFFTSISPSWLLFLRRWTGRTKLSLVTPYLNIRLSAACPLQNLTDFHACFALSFQGEETQGNSSTGPFLPMGEVSKPHNLVASPH